MKKYTDTELSDYLQQKSEEGCCPGLINDDDCRWAVTETGMQQCPSKTPSDLWTNFFVKKKEWKKSVREALIAYRKGGQ